MNLPIYIYKAELNKKKAPSKISCSKWAGGGISGCLASCSMPDEGL